jgi:membrane protein implicated in regulation of membrane protease activity
LDLSLVRGGGLLIFVYIGCLTVGVAYAAIAALLDSHGFDHGSADHTVMHAHDGGDSADVPSPFNPVVIASAISTFGAVGIIGKAGFGMSDLSSMLVSLIFSGAIGAAIFFGIVKFMYGSQSNSAYSQEDLVGMEAEVLTPLPRNGLGEIVFVSNGMRHNYTAKSAYNEEIKRGETVRIKDISGNVALVVRKMTIDNYEAYDVENRKPQNNENN